MGGLQIAAFVLGLVLVGTGLGAMIAFVVRGRG
jgi:hypothetical protein